MANPEHWFEYALGFIMTILGWFHKTLYDEHRALQQEVSNLKSAMATREEIEKLRLELKGDLNDGFNRIHSRLDTFSGNKDND